MNQLGFTEQENVTLLGKTRKGGQRGMEMKSELVVCQGLTKVYGSLKALDTMT